MVPDDTGRHGVLLLCLNVSRTTLDLLLNGQSVQRPRQRLTTDGLGEIENDPNCVGLFSKRETSKFLVHIASSVMLLLQHSTAVIDPEQNLMYSHGLGPLRPTFSWCIPTGTGVARWRH